MMLCLLACGCGFAEEASIFSETLSLDDYELVYEDEEYANYCLIDGERSELDFAIDAQNGLVEQASYGHND